MKYDKLIGKVDAYTKIRYNDNEFYKSNTD